MFMAGGSGSRTVFSHEQLLLLLYPRVGTRPVLDHQGTVLSGHSDGSTGPQPGLLLRLGCCMTGVGASCWCLSLGGWTACPGWAAQEEELAVEVGVGGKTGSRGLSYILLVFKEPSLPLIEHYLYFFQREGG